MVLRKKQLGQKTTETDNSSVANTVWLALRIRSCTVLYCTPYKPAWINKTNSMPRTLPCCAS